MIKPSGASQFKDEDYADALYCSQIVSASGLGTYSRQQLEAHFRQPGKGDFQLLPYVNHTKIGFRGWYSPGRLEDMLKYLYLYLTKPRVDSTALANWKKEQRIKILLDEQNNNLKLQSFTRNFFKGLPFISEESIDAINEKKVIDSYKSLLSDPKGYILVISGDFDLNTTMKLCNKYLGGIPKSSSKHKLIIEDKINPNDHTIPKGPLSFNLESNDPRKSDVRVVYSGDINYSPGKDAGLFLLNQILWKRMHNRLRDEEKNSTVYGASSHYELYNQNEYYMLTIKFNCVPSKAERLIAAVQEEVKILKEKGPDSKVLKNTLSELFLNLMPLYKENAEYMTIQFIDRYKYNKERVPVYKLKDYIKNITIADVKALAQKYLKEENYYQFVASKQSSQVKNNNL